MKNQCRQPAGWLGRIIVRNMNQRHSSVTDWGLSHIPVPVGGAILDVGCGGGRTIAKLAAKATDGKVYGVDHSAESVKIAAGLNADLVAGGRVEIRLGSVSKLPFPDGMFDLVTAVETHFFWPDLRGDTREVFRVVHPGGRFLVIAEVYRGAPTTVARLCEKHAPKTGMILLTPGEHQELLEAAGFRDVELFTWPEKGWICATGRKPAAK